MDLAAYKVRLGILLEQQVISNEAHDVALQAFQQLTEIVKKTDIEQAEMLFTHLPMALSRIDSGEEVEQPAAEIMREIEESSHFTKVKEQVQLIEEKWSSPLPQGEKEYLYMHYTNVLNTNL
ncbi:PRD domain-containing protein [Salirhabdus sp. Marseille-P4669]|uniref:PRD domain-containing protein n=1 Tax=Salirhabdus sp. Marseille-P4669 TaxID=2042310 RepID=UPI00135ABE33|nr:PRD domain-containing protein [Salirhabdus sp. Marseille-P4669]